MNNLRCDGNGSGNCSGDEVRVLPSTHGNEIVCYAHWHREVIYRHDRVDYASPAERWENLAVYEAPPVALYRVGERVFFPWSNDKRPYTIQQCKRRETGFSYFVDGKWWSENSISPLTDLL